jgi:hypothetical protein
MSLIGREGFKLSTKFVSKEEKGVPTILSNERYNLIHKDHMVSEIPEGDCLITLPISELPNDSWVFYWAAVSSEDPLVIKGPEVSQGDINHGLQKTDEQGVVQVTLHCPQVYKVGPKTYPRHLHYVVEEKMKIKSKWSPIKHYGFTCPLSRRELEDTLRHKTAYVIFTLPEEYFESDHIPGTLNLPRETLDGLSTTVKKNKVKGFLRDHLKSHPTIEEKVRGGHLDLLDIPIVVYCMNDSCQSSSRMISHLADCGIYNVKEWIPGLKGWREEVSDLDIQDIVGPRRDKETPEYSEDPMVFEGVEYLVVLNETQDNLLNDDYEVFGTCRHKNGEILSVEWAHPEAQKTHEDLRITPEEVPESLVSEVPESKVRESLVSDLPESKVRESILSDTSDTSDEYEEQAEIYSYTNHSLMKLTKAQLREIAESVPGIDPTSYSLPTSNKNKKELMGLITECQGKKTVKGSPHPYWKEGDLKGLSVDELETIVKDMSNRGSNSYKVSLTSKTKEALTKYIIQCRGTPTRKVGIQRGWGYSSW